MENCVVIPTDKTFDEIMKDQINPLAIKWLILKSTKDRFDGSAKAFMLQCVRLANIYKEDLKDIYDEAVAEANSKTPKKKLTKLGIE